MVSTLVSTLGGFLFGYDNIVVSGAIGHLSRYFALDAVGIGWAAGCALIGCLAGSACAGVIADKIGLKRALYGCAVCFALSSFGLLTASTFVQYTLWRILGGIGIGSASIVAPMYIAEIAPAIVRGRLVVFYQLGIVTGILCSVFVNMLIESSHAESWQIQHGWRWMFAAAGVPAIFFAAAIALSSESPRWLMKTGRGVESERVLASINGASAAAAEANSIRSALAMEEGGFGELLKPALHRPLLIGFLLAAFSQTSGITCLLSFLPEVFKSSGQNSANAFSQSVQVSLVNLMLTILAIWLVDKAGRKTLILAGTFIQTLSLAGVGYLYLAGGHPAGILLGIMAFVAGHAVGNGAVCWVIISEVFPNKVRGAAMSIATTAIWIFAYLANQFFPVLQNHLGSGGTFLVFAGLAALNFIFVLTLVPETKGYSLEQITGMWSTKAVREL